MNKLITILSLLILVGGCHKSVPPDGRWDNQPEQRRAEPPKPEYLQVLDKVDEATSQIRTFKADVLSITKRRAITITARGQFFYQPEKNMRLTMHTVIDNRLSTDMGSNPDCFWFFIRRLSPREMYYCSYADIPLAHLKDMLDPAWMIESMNFRSTNRVRLQAEKQGGNWVYVQPKNTASHQGIICITVVDPSRSVVTAHYLQTRNKKLLASMVITSFIKVNGISVPKTLEINWPEEELRISWQFSDILINQPIEWKTFEMPELGVRKANLAAGTYRDIND